MTKNSDLGYRGVHPETRTIIKTDSIVDSVIDEHIKELGGEDGYFVRKQDVGVIAQDMQKVLPEVVAERPDGTLAVKYERVVALLIAAVKELNQKHEALINQLKVK